MQPLLIVSLEDRLEQIKAAASQFIHPSAARFLRVEAVCPDWGNRLQELTRIIDRKAQEIVESTGSETCTILLDTEVKCNTSVLGYYFQVERSSFSALVNTSFRRQTAPYLLKVLARQGLSKVAYAKDLAKGWSHAALTDRDITKWLDQFAAIGYPWIGEAFLTLLDVLTPGQLGDLLKDSIDLHESDSVYCARDPSVTGKSGDVLANILRKRNARARLITDLDEFFHGSPNGALRIVEDGIWTATEQIGVLESLLGLRRGTRKHEKVKPLSDPSVFRQRDVVLQFSVGSDFGQSALSKFLEVHKLYNVKIQIPESRSMTVLSDEGRAFFDGDFDLAALWEVGPPDGVVSPYIFQSDIAWGGAKRLNTARRVCHDLGEQLFKRYLERQQAIRGWRMWDVGKIRKCSLGMWGLGLSFAFCHSVPKATHPVFWSGGAVRIDRKAIDWYPLFPHAE